MASAPPGAGAGGEEPAPGPAPAPAPDPAPPAPARSRWGSEIKVYSRKYPRKNPKPPPPPEPEPDPNPNPLSETLSSIRRSIRRGEAGLAAARSDPAAAGSAPEPTQPGEPAAASVSLSPGLNRDVGGGVPNGHGDDPAAATVKAEKARKRRERSELRRRLAGELDQVRVLTKRLKEAAEALAQEPPPPVALPSALPPPPQVVDVGYLQPQFPASDMVTPISAQLAPTIPPVRSVLQRRPLTVSVVHSEPFEKEKRTPKANQLYQNSEFLLAKDRIPPSDSHGRKKSKHHKKKHRSHETHGAEFDAERRLYSHAFKKSSSLLSRLMKHKFGWVFNKPVDPVALGLHDYFAIIKHPMDLGTIRGRLSRGQYRNPKDFAADVRLTFHNAMTYNPKGQDVHIMAEQLSGIFEAQWPDIEAEVNYLASCPPLPKKFPPPPIDLRFLDRSDSLRHHMALDSNSRPISHTPTYSARTPSMKKPRAKDPNKRDMTIEEKRKLSDNLQNLPPEKLDAVVQIIKNKNLSVRQHDDEIEVEIDSMDAETLWELDRFVANYKKNLSKQKRKAERLMLARQDAELRAQHAAQQPQPIQVTQEPNAGEKSPKQNMKDLMAGEQPATSAPDQNDNNRQNASSSSNSSSSSSDSGSSSSDSDSDSSSSDESEAAKSS
ncbi:hypothetical protein QOZ80_5AG0364000 [Eleusine coracana subsp. coracana]|nr:hypothetical protein QOZ80_5AG0364000 [Eleusine coracana subsp. coracana]